MYGGWATTPGGLRACVCVRAPAEWSGSRAPRSRCMSCSRVGGAPPPLRRARAPRHVLDGLERGEFEPCGTFERRLNAGGGGLLVGERTACRRELRRQRRLCLRLALGLCLAALRRVGCRAKSRLLVTRLLSRLAELLGVGGAQLLHFFPVALLHFEQSLVRRVHLRNKTPYPARSDRAAREGSRAARGR